MTKYKLYVLVNADHSADGTCTPRSLVVNDREYEIDRVRDRRRSASTAVGGKGVKYTIDVCGQTTNLYDEENGRWFVEAKKYGGAVS
ncbi:MAG: hypothetical protein IJM45_11025 [Clostridia bacterium]|nr:hypothetical protein [Clostridia bacterium]MCR5688868.1 hypothetical protein [Clostridiales bacterium]